MDRRFLAIGLALLAIASVECASPTQTRDRWAELVASSRPAPELALLDDMVGSFDVEVRFELPGASASTWTGASTHAWALGGRYLECRGATGAGELSVETVRFVGFDDAADQFTAITLDSVSDGSVETRGGFDAASRTIAFKGETVDRASGARVAFTDVLRIVDRDHHVRERWQTGAAGEPIQVARSSYARRAASPSAATPK